MTTQRRNFLRLCGYAGIGTLTGCLDYSETDETAVNQIKLTATDGDQEEAFGMSVSVSSDGTTTIIGATGTDGSDSDKAGSAYVFEKSRGSWTKQAKLTPKNDDKNERFGNSVALSEDGTTAIVADYRDNGPHGPWSGSVYLFENTDDSWTQQIKLTPDDGETDDQFGSSVAISNDGTTAIIGAVGDATPNAQLMGSAYVFETIEGSWIQRAKLTADDGDTGDSFGMSVSVSDDGSTAIIGASADDNTNGPQAGSAYVFDGSSESWGQQAKLIPDDGARMDFFGKSVALSSDGTTAIIGAVGDWDQNGDKTYVFEATEESWVQQATLTDDGDRTDRFGVSAAVSNDGTTAIVGAFYDDNQNGEDAGAVYVFKKSGESWTREVKHISDDGDPEDSFGYAVAMSSDGTTAVVGAPDDVDPNGEYAGSAYVLAL